MTVRINVCELELTAVRAEQRVTATPERLKEKHTADIFTRSRRSHSHCACADDTASALVSVLALISDRPYSVI